MEIKNNNNDILYCSMCNYIVNDPFTCENCESINFCKECIDELIKNKDLKKLKCPLCQEKLILKKNNSLFDLLNNMKNFKCNFCHNKFDNINEYFSHKSNCQNESNLSNNNFENINKDYETSIYDINYEHSIHNIEAISQSEIFIDINKINYGMQQFCDLFNKSNKSGPPLNEDEIPRQCQLNKEYDIYYCGKSTNFKCNCPQKICRPGCCLCPICMHVNKVYHKLEENYFINKIGYVSKKSSSNHNFYCKRNYRVKENNKPMINKHCDNLNPCDACKELNLLEKFYINNNI